MSDRKTRVMVVDDEPVARQMMSLILDSEHEVTVAESAGDALEKFVPGEFAVVVSDLKMPGPSGIDLLADIAALDPDCTRILLTAYGHREAIIEAVNRGAIFLYLDKPCDPPALRMAVRRGAERWALERDRRSLAAQVSDMEKVAVVGRVASSVAHDIRNYLVPLLVASSESDPGQMTEALDTARDASEAILALVDEMQSLAKGRVPRYTMKAGSVTKVIEDSVDWVRRGAYPAAKTIKVDLAPVPDVRLSQGSLRRVFINLLRNAVDASTAESQPIEVRAEREGRWAVIKVIDHGTGMPPEVVERAFEPFFSTKGDRGTGLGLYICRTIVAGHGGTITLDSKPGAGTTVEIRLPTAQP